MRQLAPEPLVLDDLVTRLRYKPGWRFVLDDVNRGQGCAGLTLCVYVSPADSYRPEQSINVVHYFPVPAAAFGERSWRRWLLDCILLVEQHEACEFFRLGTLRPYAPQHGPGHNPYTISEMTTDEERRTAFTGRINE